MLHLFLDEGKIVARVRIRSRDVIILTHCEKNVDVIIAVVSNRLCHTLRAVVTAGREL